MKALGIVPQPKFSQATIVTGAFIAAWFLWLAAQNKICTYYRILLGAGAASNSGSTSTTTGAGVVGGVPSGVVTGITGTPGTSATVTVTPVPPGYGGVGSTMPQN